MKRNALKWLGIFIFLTIGMTVKTNTVLSKQLNFSLTSAPTNEITNKTYVLPNEASAHQKPVVEVHSKIPLSQYLTPIEIALGKVIVNDNHLDEVVVTNTGEQIIPFSISFTPLSKLDRQITLDVVDTTPPMLFFKDIVVAQGTQVDPLSEVTAHDSYDGDVTDAIRVTGNLDTTIVGTHTLTYAAQDSSHNKTIAKRTITVVEPTQETSDNLTISDTIDFSPKSSTTVFRETKKQYDSYAHQAQRIQFLGHDIPYENGGVDAGQSIIDRSDSIASTWGGNIIQSGSDGANTHFIGHNPGIFSSITSLYMGANIRVSDQHGVFATYTVNNIFQVDTYGVGTHDQIDYMESISGAGGGERVTLQTCLSDTVNLIIQAR